MVLLAMFAALVWPVSDIPSSLLPAAVPSTRTPIRLFMIERPDPASFTSMPSSPESMIVFAAPTAPILTLLEPANTAMPSFPLADTVFLKMSTVSAPRNRIPFWPGFVMMLSVIVVF